MTSTTVFPFLCVELQRYTDPDAFRFYTYEPHPVSTRHANKHPFAGSREDRGQNYIETNNVQLSTLATYMKRVELMEAGYRRIDFADLPISLAHWVTHSEAPLEFHGALDRRDPEVMKMVWLWVRGDLPTA
jgi:hypothetical protein